MKKYIITQAVAIAALMSVSVAPAFAATITTATAAPSISVQVLSKDAVIKDITIPHMLGARQRGYWYIDAMDPENKPLTYAIDWGDNTPVTWQKTPELIHVYKTAGTYNVKYMVGNGTDDIITVKSSVKIGPRNR